MSITDRARTRAERRFPSGSDLDRICRLVVMETVKWAVSLPVTDEEVLAALNADYAIRHPGTPPADSLEPYSDETVRIMRAALEAVREAQR